MHRGPSSRRARDALWSSRSAQPRGGGGSGAFDGALGLPFDSFTRPAGRSGATHSAGGRHNQRPTPRTCNAPSPWPPQSQAGAMVAADSSSSLVAQQLGSRAAQQQASVEQHEAPWVARGSTSGPLDREARPTRARRVQRSVKATRSQDTRPVEPHHFDPSRRVPARGRYPPIPGGSWFGLSRWLTNT